MILLNESQEIKNVFPEFGDLGFDVSFSLQGGRCVYKELYEEYSGVSSSNEIIGKILQNPDVLVIYRISPAKIVPMFQKYADGRLFSNRAPRKFGRRSPRQGAAPWEYESDTTLFIIKRIMKNENFGPTDIRLIVGGFDETDSKVRWHKLNSILSESKSHSI